MTEKEAIKWVEAFKKTYKGYPKEVSEACDITVKALEEIQQYRAIGTVEEAKNQKHNLGVAYKIINDYQQIGTVEECRAAVEKQMPKNIHIKPYSATYCPFCNYELSDFRGNGYYKHPTFLKRCPKCGQAIDWSEEDV